MVLLFSVLRSSTLTSKPSSNGGRSDSSFALSVEMVNPSGLGSASGSPVAGTSQLCLSISVLSIVNVKFGLISQFISQVRKIGYFLDSFEIQWFSPVLGRNAVESWRLSIKITGVAFSKCVCPLPSVLSQLTSLHLSPGTCPHCRLA